MRKVCADGADGTVGRRLGTLGGKPEGLKGAETTRGGVVLVSEVSEYMESRDARSCQPPLTTTPTGVIFKL